MITINLRDVVGSEVQIRRESAGCYVFEEIFNLYHLYHTTVYDSN